MHKGYPDAPLNLIKPCIGDIVVGVECMHCWYWVADFYKVQLICPKCKFKKCL